MTSPSPDAGSLPAFTDRLVCVVGVGRSGTTVLKNALGAHPQLLAAQFEAPLERALASSYGRHLIGSAEFEDYVRSTTVASWDNVRTSFRKLIVDSALGNDAGRDRLAEERSGGRDVEAITGWVIKVGGLWRPAVTGFTNLFDGFTPVYVHRNGIDVVESRRHFGTFADQAFEKSCRKWASGLKVLRALEEHCDVHLVAHQDLVTEPEQTMGEVIKALSLAPSPASAQHLQQRSPNATQDSDDELSVAENFANREPAHLTWTDDEKRTFIDLCSPAMQTYGYELPFS